MKVGRSISSIIRLTGIGVVAAMALVATGCAKKIDRLVIDKVIAEGVTHDDIDRVCATGDALGIALGSLTKKAPQRALVMADVSAAMCLERRVREAQLDGAFARYHYEGEEKVNAILDARYREERAHTAAAYRYWRAFQGLEAEYGEVGADECPKIKDKDQVVYLMGLYGGIHGMLHDKAGGGQVGVPFDVLGKVARATECIDNERWWHVPDSFKWAAYATLANEEHGDPWVELDKSAEAGAAQGIRLARAVQVMINGNADRTDDLRAGIGAHAASLDEIPPSVEFAAMDRYALDITQHESDLLWTRETGHRSPRFGELPDDGSEEVTAPDPFGGNPFGGDPFGGDGDDSDESEGSEEPETESGEE